MVGGTLSEEELQIRREYDAKKAEEIELLSSLTVAQIVLFLKIVDELIDPAAEMAYREDGPHFEFIKKFFEEIKKYDSKEIAQQEYAVLLVKLKGIMPSSKEYNIHIILSYYVRRVLYCSRAIDHILHPDEILFSTRAEMCWQIFVSNISRTLELEKGDLELLASKETNSKKMHAVLNNLSPRALGRMVSFYLQLMGEFVHRDCEAYVEATHNFIYMVKKALLAQGHYDHNEPNGMLVGGVLLKWLKLEKQWEKALPNILSPRNGYMPQKVENYFISNVFARWVIDLPIYNQPYSKAIYLQRQVPDSEELIAKHKTLLTSARKEKKKEKKEEKKKIPPLFVPMFQGLTLNNPAADGPTTPTTPRGGPPGPLLPHCTSSSSSSSVNLPSLRRSPPRCLMSHVKKELSG